MSTAPHPIVLLILDGFGHSERSEHNAIANANTPTWDRYWSGGSAQNTTLLHSSGKAVGLPEGQMGNSEVGHMTLGSGRIIHQDLTRIEQAIESGDFATNAELNNAITQAQAARGAVHILGLCSPGGVHSHEDHIIATIQLAADRGATSIYVHGFLDGRDTPPKSAKPSLKKIEAALKATGRGRIASICGRFYAMDRDNRWDRIQQAYELLTLSTAAHYASDALEGLEAAYHREETDEFVQPTWIGDSQATIQAGDTVIFANFRADRARQLTRAFVDATFNEFKRSIHLPLAQFVTFTEYAESIKAPIAFPPQEIDNDLGDIVSQQGLQQLRIAETEKYAHVTFFFSGGKETPYEGEDRVLIPSPDVKTYDLKPEMSANEVTENLVDAIHSKRYALIVCNYANGDMVGHTGNYTAATQAVEVLDTCLTKVIEACHAAGSYCLITADHGNCETMVNETTGEPLTSHTTGPVPLVCTDPAIVLSSDGRLCDVAPTVLTLMGLTQPEQMTGRSLIEQHKI